MFDFVYAFATNPFGIAYLVGAFITLIVLVTAMEVEWEEWRGCTAATLFWPMAFLLLLFVGAREYCREHRTW